MTEVGQWCRCRWRRWCCRRRPGNSQHGADVLRDEARGRRGCGSHSRNVLQRLALRFSHCNRYHTPLEFSLGTWVTSGSDPNISPADKVLLHMFPHVPGWVLITSGRRLNTPRPPCRHVGFLGWCSQQLVNGGSRQRVSTVNLVEGKRCADDRWAALPKFWHGMWWSLSC